MDDSVNPSRHHYRRCATSRWSTSVLTLEVNCLTLHSSLTREKKSTMKFLQTITLLSTIASSVESFAPLSPHRQSRPTVPHFMVAEQDVVAGSAMPVADPYERIGITKEEIAIGVDATEFLQWIGR